jgi:hypothetical protein
MGYTPRRKKEGIRDTSILYNMVMMVLYLVEFVRCSKRIRTIAAARALTPRG